MPDYVPPSATTPYKSIGGGHVRQFVNDSISSSSMTVAAPGAGSTVTFLVVPITGTYSVQLLYGYVAGTPAATSPNNIRLQVQNVTISSLTMLALVNTMQAATFILTVLRGQSIGLNVINTDVAQVGGTIIATQMG